MTILEKISAYLDEKEKEELINFVNSSYNNQKKLIQIATIIKYSNCECSELEQIRTILS